MNSLEKSILNWIESQGNSIKNIEVSNISDTLLFIKTEENKGFIVFYTSGNDVFFPSNFSTPLWEVDERKKVNNLENIQLIVLIDDVSESSIENTEKMIENTKSNVILVYEDNNSLEVIRRFDYTES